MIPTRYHRKHTSNLRHILPDNGSNNSQCYAPIFIVVGDTSLRPRYVVHHRIDITLRTNASHDSLVMKHSEKCCKVDLISRVHNFERRRADLDVRMSHVTRSIRVASCNRPSANRGNDQDTNTHRYEWLVFVSFQPLRFVPPPPNGSRKRVLAERIPLLNIIQNILSNRLFHTYLRTLSGCPTAQSSRCVLTLLGTKVVITRTDAACTTPYLGLDANKVHKVQ